MRIRNEPRILGPTVNIEIREPRTLGRRPCWWIAFSVLSFIVTVSLVLLFRHRTGEQLVAVTRCQKASLADIRLSNLFELLQE
jgi:hypothetical protein